MQGGRFKKDTRIDGKVVIITGANSGIGKVTAIDLARRGGKVYIACRDRRRGEDSLSEIVTVSGSTNVHLMQLDLASQESIREFSQKFHEVETKLHILINNAGVMACTKSFTKEGFEMHFGVNHLGHFLLTNLLLDLLKASAPSRVVVVSSLFHIVGKIRKADLGGEKFYSRWFQYASSKLANILFTRALARRLVGTGVTANSLHPGLPLTFLSFFCSLMFCLFRCCTQWLTTSREYRDQVIQNFNSQNLLIYGPNSLHRILTAPLQWVLFKETVAGAQTQIRLAVDPELEHVSGKYFSDCKECWTMCTANNDATAEWLWGKSLELTNL